MGTGLEPGTTDTPVDKCYLGGGVLSALNSSCGGEGQLACDDPDLDEPSKPTEFGACADCHASGIDGELGDRIFMMRLAWRTILESIVIPVTKSRMLIFLSRLDMEND